MKVNERAGTTINHACAERLEVGGRQLGLIDRSKSLYQFGGRRSTFVLWKYKVLGLGLPEWEAVKGDVSVIEFVEQECNEAWRIDTAKAIAVGYEYSMAGRRRYGIPMDAFDVYDAQGNLVRAAAE